jgi:hypothetical protein
MKEKSHHSADDTLKIHYISYFIYYFICIIYYYMQNTYQVLTVLSKLQFLNTSVFHRLVPATLLAGT